MRLQAVLLLGISFLMTCSLDAGPRRRAVGKTLLPDASTPEGWLIGNADVLAASELVPFSTDLEPLRAMIGNAGVVGIGDATHGTREFYTMRLRLIDFLVREMGFDLVALEASLPIMNRIDAYVQGGAGDARTILREMRPLGFYYWDAEELLDVVEWMREYNLHRGDKPAVRVAGFDVFEPRAAADYVIAYLRAVDPASAPSAESEYSCITPATRFVMNACRDAAERVFEALEPREAELAPKSSVAAFQEALQHARVVVQSSAPVADARDESMVANTLWLREHRGTTRKMIVWGHSMHLSKASNEALRWPMGRLLDANLGDDYFVITTMTAAGTFRQWDFNNQQHVIMTLPPLIESAYESYFRRRGVPLLLIPLQGALPSWLTTPARYNISGGTGAMTAVHSLPAHYDATIFIDTTTPLHAIE